MLNGSWLLSPSPELCLPTKCSPPSLRVKFLPENKEGAQAWTFGFQAQGPSSRPHLNFLWISPAYHAASRGKKGAKPIWACSTSDSLEASPQILLRVLMAVVENSDFDEGPVREQGCLNNPHELLPRCLLPTVAAYSSFPLSSSPPTPHPLLSPTVL